MTGRRATVAAVPADVRAAFVTALEISPDWHLKMQTAVQRHVDAAVAKTVNLPSRATPADVQELYLAAWRARLKRITVYRYGARPDQVLTNGRPGPPFWCGGADSCLLTAVAAAGICEF